MSLHNNSGLTCCCKARQELGPWRSPLLQVLPTCWPLGPSVARRPSWGHFTDHSLSREGPQFSRSPRHTDTPKSLPLISASSESYPHFLTSKRKCQLLPIVPNLGDDPPKSCSVGLRYQLFTFPLQGDDAGVPEIFRSSTVASLFGVRWGWELHSQALFFLLTTVSPEPSIQQALLRPAHCRCYYCLLNWTLEVEAISRNPPSNRMENQSTTNI